MELPVVSSIVNTGTGVVVVFTAAAGASELVSEDPCDGSWTLLSPPHPIVATSIVQTIARIAASCCVWSQLPPESDAQSRQDQSLPYPVLVSLPDLVRQAKW